MIHQLPLSWVGLPPSAAIIDLQICSASSGDCHEPSGRRPLRKFQVPQIETPKRMGRVASRATMRCRAPGAKRGALHR